MSSELRAYTPNDLETLRALVRHPSLAGELDTLQGPDGLEALLADPFFLTPLLTLLEVDGEPAGFGFSLMITGREHRWSFSRIGIVDRFRRRGFGTAMLEHLSAGIRRLGPDAFEECTAAWLPNPGAQAFVARHGFQPVRSFWMMERPLGPIPDPVWPPGITLETYDRSERHVAAMCDAYNDSFSQHYHSPAATLEEVRALFSRPGFRDESLTLAFREGRGVGFCRGELFPNRGEIAVLGTTHEARGIGLGRALLRRGVRWLEAAGATRVTLLVDGANEGALGLYRNEGFAVTRQRDVWSRPGPGARR